MPAKYVKSPKYVAPDGSEFNTLEEEQKYELASITDKLADVASLNIWLLEHKTEIIAILSQKPRKNASPATPKPRKPRTRKPAVVEPPNDNWKTETKP